MRLILYILGAAAAAIAVFVIIGIIAALPWWSIISVSVVIGAIAIWFLTLFDLWRRADVSPAGRIIWTVAIIVFPLLGTIVYFFTRPPAGEVQYRGETVT